MVAITKFGNVINVSLGLNDINTYELAAVANSFSFNSVTLIVTSRFFKNWGLQVPLNTLTIDGVIPANEAAFNAALATLSTVTTSGGGGGGVMSVTGNLVDNTDPLNPIVSLPDPTAHAGEFLTTDGTVFSWAAAGGSAPITPDTQIAFGNGVDPYTSSGDFVYDVAGDPYFKVGLLGDNNLSIGQGSFTFTTALGRFIDFNDSDNWLRVSDGSGSILLFDFGNSTFSSVFGGGNDTRFIQSDASQTLTYQKGADVYWKADIANTLFEYGDLPNNSKVSFDPNNAGLFEIMFGGDSRFEINYSSNIILREALVKIESVSNAVLFSTNTGGGSEAGFWGNPGGNLTGISWDDAGKSITNIADFTWVFKSAANNRFLLADPGNSNYGIGDLDGFLNGTHVYISDADKQIELMSANGATSVILDGTANSIIAQTFLFQAGDIANFGNSTKGVFDDAAQTITLSAVNGIKFANQANLAGYTVATLPAGTIGDIAYVTDALLPSFLVTVAGSGAVVTPVFYNGTNWVAY